MIWIVVDLSFDMYFCIWWVKKFVKIEFYIVNNKCFRRYNVYMLFCIMYDLIRLYIGLFVLLGFLGGRLLIV